MAGHRVGDAATCREARVPSDGDVSSSDLLCELPAPVGLHRENVGQIDCRVEGSQAIQSEPEDVEDSSSLAELSEELHLVVAMILYSGLESLWCCPPSGRRPTPPGNPWLAVLRMSKRVTPNEVRIRLADILFGAG